MSRKTRSGCNSSIFSTASSPSRASPTTTMSGWAASRRPRRARADSSSSTMMLLIADSSSPRGIRTSHRRLPLRAPRASPMPGPDRACAVARRRWSGHDTRPVAAAGTDGGPMPSSSILTHTSISARFAPRSRYCRVRASVPGRASSHSPPAAAGSAKESVGRRLPAPRRW